MRLILSYLRQILTPTLGPVTPTGTKTPEEMAGAEEALAAKTTVFVEAIAETA